MTRAITVFSLVCRSFVLWSFCSATLAADLQAPATENADAAPAAVPIGLCHKPDIDLPEGVDSGSGFRMHRYRAPVPSTLPGGCVLSDAEARQLWQQGTARFIDVYPPRGMGADPLDGTWLITEKRSTIPGAVWLPEVGRGYLDTDHEAYFRRNIELLGGDRRHIPLVFFCTADCWQSWNAARRAILWHYPIVYWYPEGTDGWRDTGGDQVPATAVNFLHSRDVELAPLQSR